MSADRDTIDAVAAVIAYQFGHEMGTPPKIQFVWAARALAEEGRLKDPADEIVTPEDRAVLDAADAYADAYETLTAGVPYSVTRHNETQGALCSAAVRARRVAAGGTTPADPEAQP